MPQNHGGPDLIDKGQRAQMRHGRDLVRRRAYMVYSQRQRGLGLQLANGLQHRIGGSDSRLVTGDQLCEHHRDGIGQHRRIQLITGGELTGAPAHSGQWSAVYHYSVM
ncbi:hypothetical protein [Comamonas sp. Z1]|uniref:hypothetical protein n=1 Tax=Comamonas sp. Z1 TaxID=2601246 RepID=UPI001CA37042|nr:hypothetical protein [Comamonas sp. Z1]